MADAREPADDKHGAGAFDRRVNAVLADEAALLDELAATLLARGFTAVERPQGRVEAWLERPALRRRGRLEVRAAHADGARSARQKGPTSARYRDPDALLSEIILTLAIYLAGLQEDE